VDICNLLLVAVLADPGIHGQVPAAITTFPSSAQIVPEPLGVVLIISAWNYPFCKFYTAFMPFEKFH
jgi:acyl-CoA reductase-like NAD-dependent aldehyde dehydrogenase